MNGKWEQYSGDSQSLIERYWDFLLPHEMNFSTISFIANSKSISINHESKSIRVLGTLSGIDVIAYYGRDSGNHLSEMKKGIVISNSLSNEEAINTIQYGVLDLRSNWRNDVRPNLRRQLKEIELHDLKMYLYPAYSRDWENTLEKIYKFLFLKDIKFPIRFVLDSKNKRDWLHHYFHVGKVRVDDEHEVLFLVSELGNVLSADYHFSTGSGHNKKLNFTTAFHAIMLDWAQKKRLRYYSLGIVESESFANFSGIKRYKEMWQAQKFYQYLYRR